MGLVVGVLRRDGVGRFAGGSLAKLLRVCGGDECLILYSRLLRVVVPVNS